MFGSQGLYSHYIQIPNVEVFIQHYIPIQNLELYILSYRSIFSTIF